MQAVPGLIDMGIDILQALQFDAKGMDPVTLKTNYGNKLCFEGGVSIQSTLPFGTVSDVEEEVRERIKGPWKRRRLHPRPFACNPGRHPTGEYCGDV